MIAKVACETFESVSTILKEGFIWKSGYVGIYIDWPARVRIMSLLFNRIEHRCAAHIVHTCQQY